VKLKWDRITLGGPAKAGGAVVTFQAHGEYNRAAQQPGVGRSMGIMTNFAAFHANWRMLIDKRSTLFHVAFEAGLLAAVHLFDHGGSSGCAPGGCERSMRVVAIATGHDTFVNAMLEGHGELGANIGVALVAQLRLHFRQQKFRSGGRVDGVTAGTHNIVLGVGGSADVGAGECLGMTAQAVVLDLLGLELGEGDDAGLSAVGLDVCLAGTVAAFASGMLGRLFAGGDAFEVRVLIKFRPDVGMAGFTRLAAYEAAGCGAALSQTGWLRWGGWLLG